MKILRSEIRGAGCPGSTLIFVTNHWIDMIPEWIGYDESVNDFYIYFTKTGKKTIRKFRCRNSILATEFVRWFSNHPEFTDEIFTFSDCWVEEQVNEKGF